MKTILAMSLLTISMSAQASFFMEVCSSADGSTKSSSGHVENSLTVTERKWDSNGKKETTIELSRLENISVETEKETSLESKNSSHCDPKHGSGYASWSSVGTKKIKISKTDGSLFSKETVGVSEDQKSVSAFLICAVDGNSMIVCDQHNP